MPSFLFRKPVVKPSPSPAVAGPGAPGRVIVVFGTKGGVGKTMVAANLAVSLAQRAKQPVCLLDLDVLAVGDVCKMLNIDETKPLAELWPAAKFNALTGPPPLDGAVRKHGSGIDILAAFSNPRQAGRLDPRWLPPLFQELKRRYAFIIVDGGRAFSETLVAAFDAASLILLVTSPEVIALYQTKWALSMLEKLLFPAAMVKAVFNRADSRGSVEMRDVRGAVSCEVLSEIPSDGKSVGMAMNQGLPVVTAFASTRVAEAFGRLADVLITRQDLYVDHQNVPRHRRAGAADDVLGADAALWTPMAPGWTGEPLATADEEDEVVRMKRRIHAQLMEQLDLKKLDLGPLGNSAKVAELRQKIEPVIAGLLTREMGGLLASHEVRTRLVREIADEAVGLGPLEELLADPEVTDILVNSKDQIYVERRGKLELTSKKFLSNEQVRAVIERIVAPLGRRVDEANPMVDARLPDGSRVNAIISPLSLKGPALSIRKFSRVRYVQEDLVHFGSMTPAMAQFLRACVVARKNMIISGGTGSGKTTLLNVVSLWIPDDERIVTIEDAAELKLAQTHWVSLEARPSNIEGRGQVTIRDLFRNVLRMRPDRIIIGECRGGETLDMLQAMNTGHDGSITTVHANAPKDVISRLDSMVLMSNVDLPLRAIREMVASAIHLIVHTSRLSDGSRKVTAITEVMGLIHETDVRFNDIFVFQQTGVTDDGRVMGVFRATGNVPTFLDTLKVKGLIVDPAIFQATPDAAAP